jgi:hypothetical protein
MLKDKLSDNPVKDLEKKVEPKTPENIHGEIFKKILQGRYCVSRLLDNGSFGKVFKVVDMKEIKIPLAMKLQVSSILFEKEISAYKSIRSRRFRLKLDAE